MSCISPIGTWLHNKVYVAEWVGYFATVFAVIVALFKNELIRIWRKPKLKARIKLSPPDSIRVKKEITVRAGAISSTIRNDGYYFRLWVENVGNQRAEKVQVFMSKLFRRHEDGSFKEEKEFLPVNLRWSTGPVMPVYGANGATLLPEIFADGISPKMGKHCDFGSIKPLVKSHVRVGAIEQDENVSSPDKFEFNVEFPPINKTNQVDPGVYRIELKLAAANTEPVTKIIELNHKGVWYEDEGKMFSEGIGIKEI